MIHQPRCLRRIDSHEIDTNGRKLGEGGYGSVFEGRLVATGETVALKIFATVLDGWREIRFIHRVAGHPCVVDLVGYTYLEGSLCLVMKAGQRSLPITSEGTTRTMRIALAQRRRIISRIAAALSHVHRHNIIHCDIKPDNIIINEAALSGQGEADVRLCDFGMSIDYSPCAQFPERILACTDGYRSPELMALQKFDFACDIWSLGCVMYELITSKQFISPVGRKALGRNTVASLTPRPGVVVDPPDKMGLHTLISRLPPGNIRDEFCRRFNISLHRRFRGNAEVNYRVLRACGEEEELEQDLLWRMLELDPSKRPTIEEVLAHSYFDPLREEMAPLVEPWGGTGNELFGEVDWVIFDYVKRALWGRHDDYFNVARVIYTLSSLWMRCRAAGYGGVDVFASALTLANCSYFSSLDKFALNYKLFEGCFGLDLWGQLDKMRDAMGVIVEDILKGDLSLVTPLDELAVCGREFSREEIEFLLDLSIDPLNFREYTHEHALEEDIILSPDQ